MNVLIVDTSVWIEFFRGRTFVDLENALREARVILPPIVAAELMSGVKNDPEGAKLSDFLLELPWHPTREDHWLRVGQLRRSLARSGLAISIPDAHIAQCTLDCDGTLFSLDAVFQTVSRRTSLKIAL